MDENRRAQIAAVIAEIVTAVEAWRRDHPSSTDDDCDYATLRVYAATDDTVPDPDDEGGQALSRAISGLTERTSPALYGGASRVAFAVGHLSSGDEADTACELIERSLLGFVQQPSPHYDLISGHVGIAVPVLQRIADGRPSPSSEPLASALLGQLERLAEPVPTGLAWHTAPELLPDWQREIAPDGYYNLGLAHGVPGIIAILARYIAAGIEVARAESLLERAVTHLLSVAALSEGSRFPAWLPVARPGQSRIAWCYGDLGVSVALMAAATTTGRDDWRTEALALARAAAARPVDRAGVIDTGLCHGAAGVAHLFNRLAQTTGDRGLARAADTWFAQTLAMRRAEPLAGFPRGKPEDGKVIWETGADLLTGAVGVALALHAAITAIEPAWDQLLLADLSPTL